MHALLKYESADVSLGEMQEEEEAKRNCTYFNFNYWSTVYLSLPILTQTESKRMWSSCPLPGAYHKTTYQ